MKKRYIFGAAAVVIIAMFLVSLLFETKEDTKIQNSMMPRIGQKLWTYNMNKHQWSKYNESDANGSKNNIVLQVQQLEGNGGYTSYKLLTANALVPKEDVWIGEGSQEFLSGKKLYTYFPKYFEYYEVVFNGVKFITRKISDKELPSVLKDYQIIKVSELHKGTINIRFNKLKNKYVIINDTGEDFYKYFIVPNDSKKLQIGEFSNQFVLKGKTTVKIQRIEGCSKAYPCYEIIAE